MVYFDVPLLLKQQFFESTTWLKSLSVLLQNYEQNTSVLVGYTTDRLSRILPNADNNFPMPSLLFQVARIPLPKGKWGIRLPLRTFTGIRASPTRIGITSQTARGLSGCQRTYKREMADYTCMEKPAITLLYFHIYTPAIK